MNLVNRVKNILTNPKAEWQVINNEPLSGMPLITTYLLPLAVIAAIATFIGYAFLVQYSTVKYGLIYALIMFIQLILSVYISSYILDALAPSFASEKNLNKSIQVVVYSSTPVYVGAILNIIPGLGWLGTLLGAIYALYLMYLALPILKKTPEDRVPIYMIATIVIQAVIYWIIGYILIRILLPVPYGVFVR